MNRLSYIKVLAFAVLVHAFAYYGKGLLRSPLQSDWDSSVIAEAQPLARFDAGWYRSIAADGYFWNPATGVGNVAFFPLYPLMMKMLAFSGLPLFWAGALLSTACLLASVSLLRQLDTLLPGPAPTGSSLLALLTFPWAFYLLAPYSESLFLALALAVFVAALRGRWGLVAPLGFLAGLTRLFGLALVPPLLLLVWRPGPQSSAARQVPRPLAVVSALAPALGVASFVAWLGFRFRDPLVFFHAQQRGWGRHSDFSGLPSALLLIVENIRQRGLLHLGPAVDMLVVLMLFGTVVHALRSRDFLSASYVGSALLLITASGSLLSSGRYALVLFPAFGFLAVLARRPILWFTYLLFSCMLQVYLVVRFVNNLWVA